MKRNKKYNKEITKETFMNGMKHIVLFITGALVFASPPDWEDIPGDYQFSATLVGGIVLNDGVQLGNANDGDMFAAFDGAGNVRGVAFALFPTFGPYEGTCIYEMQVRSNSAGDVLHFQYYNASSDEVLDISETYDFVINDIIADADILNPMEFHVVPQLFTYNTSTQQAFYYFGSVLINGDAVDENDWVGAFNGDVCVGARKWDTSLCGNGICEVPVMGDQGAPFTEGYMYPGDVPTFRIYDTSENKYYDAIPTENYPFSNFGMNSIVALNGYIWGCTDLTACNYDMDATMDDGSCLENDCADECGGAAELDECGICGGDNSSCVDVDCAGEENGDAELDECGVCNGSGIADGACDCDGNIDDECGVCGGDNSSCGDCAGIPNGDAQLDDCGVCNGDGSSCEVYVELEITTTLDEIIEDEEELQEFEEDFESYMEIELGLPQGTVEVTNIEFSSIREVEVTIEFIIILSEEELAETTFESTEDIEEIWTEVEEEITNEGIEFVGGCTDIEACNYDELANVDDSSCEYESDCADECGGSAIEDCAGVCNGPSAFDNCGVCDSDTSNDCVCDYFDNCGVCNGNNDSCWYIDIAARVSNESLNFCICPEGQGFCVPASDNQTDCESGGGVWGLDIYACTDHPEYNTQQDCIDNGGTWTILDELELYSEDLNNRIGMHAEAIDGYNSCSDGQVECVYNDFQDPSGSPAYENTFALYFPHAGDSLWDDPFFEFFDYRFARDIRALENLNSFDDLRIWDVVVESDVPGSVVSLEFDIINDIIFRGLNGFDGNTRLFILHDGAFHERHHNSFYQFISSGEDESLQIIIGYGVEFPSVTITSPLEGEIFQTEQNFNIQLAYEESYFIDNLQLLLNVGDSTKNIYNGPPTSPITIYSTDNEIWDWINLQIGNDDYKSNFSIHANIIDLAGYDKDNENYSDYYHDEIGSLIFSRDESTISLASGWNLLAPPLSENHDLSNIFDENTYECTMEGCTFIETANSGAGFYTRSYGETSDFTFNGDVLSQFSTTLEQGWNLTGNPLVNSVDINSVIITYNNYDYNWPDAAKYGIISPTPIIYDNENGGHIGTTELSTAAGFWVHSFYDNVGISFIPSNPVEEIEGSNYWNLSLFSKKNSSDANFDESIGSEIVIGIHEDASNAIIEGEDQEVLPLSSISIFEHYNELSINSDGTPSIYRDIRSYHKTSITWDLEGESVQPFNTGEEVLFTWEFRGNYDPYDYFLDIGEGIPVNMSEVSSTDVSHDHFLENMSITAVLKEGYIGCTHPLASNYNLTTEGNICIGGTCLGGNQAEFCEILSLALPETHSIDPESSDQAFELPISLSNPQGISIEGLQFVLEYDTEMIQLNEVTLDENLEGYIIEQDVCANCTPGELLVNVYFIGLKEEFTDENENGIWDIGEVFTDINSNDLYDDDSFSSEGTILTVTGNGLENTGTTTLIFSSVQINESANAFGNSCEISIGLVYLSVSGEIIYYKNGLPVSGGSISITETDDPSNINGTLSNADGNFLVESILDDRTYELLLSKDEYSGYLDNYFDGLSAVDASRIARHSVGLYEFTEREKLAANVNFDYRCEDENGDPPLNDDGDLFIYNDSDCVENGFNWVPNIEAGDASKVAKYAAGIVEDLNNQCDPHWIFINPDMEVMIDNETCEDIPYVMNLESSISDLVFEGIRLGDVTGNWTAPLSRKYDENIVENPIVEVEVDQIVKLPLYLPNKAEIEGLDFTIQFDPEVFTLIGFNNNNSILDKSGYNTITNNDTPGMFKLVSYANSTLINDNGLLGYIKFKVVSNARTNSTIRINEMKINDIKEGGFLVEGNFESSSIAWGFDFQISVVPEVFALNNNYPNPFNPSTNIKFELADDGDVQIFIYDLKGSLVDELVNGYMEAGYHNLKWDGSRRASGVFFIQMIADNGNYIKMTKMMLVK